MEENQLKSWCSDSTSEDSGLVADAFDVLPDENTLALDEELDIDFSCETFGSISDDPWSDLTFDIPEENEIFPDTNLSNSSQEPAKLVAFNKEQARQWRRKRLLNVQQQQKKVIAVQDTTSHRKHQTLQPLLPLPHQLKPLKDGGKKKYVDIKLQDPLLGGELIKNHKGPMPMKMRALPESFWKEPNTINSSSLAGSNYAVLPPLFSTDNKNNNDDLTKIRPVTPPDEKGKSPGHSPRHKKKWIVKGETDPDLLFSLFDHLDENKIDDRLVVRRGRPKKNHSEKTPPPPPRDENNDPCIIDDLADKLFPELSLSQRTKDKINTPNYAIIKIGKGNRTIEFPAIKVAENYPAILNELVTHM